MIRLYDFIISASYVKGRHCDFQERSAPFIHWKYSRTAREVMGRLLEHHWEHLVEIEERLEK